MRVVFFDEAILILRKNGRFSVASPKKPGFLYSPNSKPILQFPAKPCALPLFFAKRLRRRLPTKPFLMFMMMEMAVAVTVIFGVTVLVVVFANQVDPEQQSPVPQNLFRSAFGLDDMGLV